MKCTQTPNPQSPPRPAAPPTINPLTTHYPSETVSQSRAIYANINAHVRGRVTGRFIARIWQFVRAGDYVKNVDGDYIKSGSEDIRADITNRRNFGQNKEGN